MSSKHDPSPEFLDHLEWQLATEARRSARFGTDPAAALPPRGRWVAMRLAALVLLSAAFGAGGVLAAEEIQSASQRELRLKQALIHLATAENRCEFLDKHVAHLRAMADAGTLPVHERQDAEDDLARHRTELGLRELDVAEVQESGRVPNDELSAPTFRGRDFVTERLRVRLDGAARERDRSARAEERVQALFERGVISSQEMNRVRMATAGAEVELRRLQERLDLRERYLAGELPTWKVDLLGLRSEALQRKETAVAKLASAQKVLERTELMVSEGVISTAELREIQREVLFLESEAELADIELKILDDQLGG